MAGGFEWISQFDRLADGDITKFDEISEKPYNLCLNLLLFWMKRDEYQERMHNYNNKKR